ncbi:MAG: glycosyl transferase, group 1 family protein [Segetibacter sp.]|jgi:glycosyltransferase involved in cell wall biosynthesis|nr:glycosyl transferase, group 1 family protein [Segetibacter sp.]
MKIAFDAKRAYQNGTGLGHYSRTLISSLATYYAEHNYYLCAPKLTNRYDASAFTNVRNIVPASFISKKFKSAWRSNWVKKDLKKEAIDIYHGLSHEIPVGIQSTGIRSVVTIHDLIFERNPEQYNWIDIQIYRRKFKYACLHANHIIAISEQTKADVANFYKIPEEKITVCYQSCNPAFAQTVPAAEKERIRQYYHLPAKFFLYVGSIIERKNLLNICKALHELNQQSGFPLVVIGDGRSYKQQVKDYIKQHGLDKRVIFLSESEAAKKSLGYQTAADFPAIYQLSNGVIYPSIFEGFGIPVLEALWSRVPVITSNISCLPETGGDAAYYVNPYSVGEIAEGMIKLATDESLVAEMTAKGWLHAQKFTPQKCAEDVMAVYLRQ